MKHYENMGSLYYQTAQKIKSNGTVIDAGMGGKAIEIINQQVGLNTPYHLGISDPTRKWSKEYAIAEFMWYLGMNKRVGCMDQFAEIWGKIKDKEGCAESNYGHYLFNDNWYWIINELETDPESRRAVISIYQNSHKKDNIRDHPCSMYVQFLVRDYKLHMIWNMRSCDFIFGLCNDMFCAAMILQLMTNELRESDLNVGCGTVSFNIGSLHCYERHWKMMFEATEYWGDPNKIAGHKYILPKDMLLNKLIKDEYFIASPMDKTRADKAVNRFNNEILKGDFF